MMNDHFRPVAAAPDLGNSALCLLADNGVLHIRTFHLCAGYVLGVLDRAGLAPDLRLHICESHPVRSGAHAPHPDVLDLHIDDADLDTLLAVGRVLRRSGVVAHAYSARYDQQWSGPLVSYDRVLPPIGRLSRYATLHSIDFGFHDGYWFFGHPTQLDGLVTMARQPHVVSSDFGGVSAFCVDEAAEGKRLAETYSARGGHIWEDQFGPSRD